MSVSKHLSRKMNIIYSQTEIDISVNVGKRYLKTKKKNWKYGKCLNNKYILFAMEFVQLHVPVGWRIKTYR